jgi:hypothetical protein
MGVVVLLHHTGGEVRVPPRGGVARIARQAIRVHARGIARGVSGAVDLRVAVAEDAAGTPGVAEGSVRADQQSAEVGAVAVDLVALILAGMAAERLTPYAVCRAGFARRDAGQPIGLG